MKLEQYSPLQADGAARPGPGFERGAVLIGLLHFIVAFVNIELTRWSTGMATVWAANALVLAALMFVPLRRWLPYIIWALLGGLLANLLAGYPLYASMPFAAINVSEVAAAAAIIRLWVGGAPQLERPADLVKFIIAAITASALSASLSAPFMSMASGDRLGHSWLSWFASDTLGMLIVTPILLIGFAIWSGNRSFLQGRSVTEAAALFTIVAALSIGVFAQSTWPLLFLLLPPVVLTTFRLRCVGATVAILIIAIVGSWFTTMGRGPIGLIDGNLASMIYFFQFFLAVAFLSALPVASVLDERDALAAIAERQAATDELTGTASRRMFLAKLGEAIETAASDQTSLSVVLFDLDHFKMVNDRFGHDVGDQVLRRIGAIAIGCVGDRGLVGRLGGEEFAILLPDRDVTAAVSVCEELKARFGDHDTSNSAVPVTISAGVAVAVAGVSMYDVLKHADAAMYAAKNSGRNRICIAGLP